MKRPLLAAFLTTALLAAVIGFAWKSAPVLGASGSADAQVAPNQLDAPLTTPVFMPIVKWDHTPTPTATPIPTATSDPGPGGGATATPTVAVPVPTLMPGMVPLVFVSRQIPNQGTIYWDAPKAMPGVGPHSRFRPAAPGKLLVRETNGSIRTLVDGSAPSAATFNLIDVNAPDVSYDGRSIVFAGLRNGSWETQPARNLGGWRLYVINVDGSGLRQLTTSDQNLNLAQFGNAAGGLYDYDDTDPAWLPDGRIVFSSTRWPSFGNYSGVRTSNLYVVNADGAAMHRITTERNGADRPLVDPLTGKIVYARWWRNQRFATDSMDVVAASGGYEQKDGLTTNRSDHVGGSDFLWRNSWHAATINPDGTELAQWGGGHHRQDINFMYGGTFLLDGRLLANYFPMVNMTEASGFGGVRLYTRGPFQPQSIIGITTNEGEYVNGGGSPSYGVFQGNYAGEPAALPNGQVVISWARDINQDYGLYVMNTDGSGLTPLFDIAGTTELRAKPIYARPLPPILPDAVNTNASALPPTAAGPYNIDGSFTFAALNVYANAPIDTAIPNAPPVGSAATIRFFADFQRTSPGSFPAQDWPILLNQMTVAPNGSVTNSAMPANLPLFEQLRSANNTVPLVPGTNGTAAHVAGMNFGRPGEVQRCMGCHTGHTMIAVPESDADAQWSNLAPGAQVTVSSARDASTTRGVIDRRVMTGEIWRYWNSAANQTSGQWVLLTFPAPISVRQVKLYNPRSGGEANSSIQVQGATVRLYSDAAATQEVASGSAGALAVTGTPVNFADVKVRAVRVEITGVTGTFYGTRLAALAEIEVLGRGEAQ